MAKKKDITRNPPSWLEKGLFIVVILIIVGIAFPIFWQLNQTTREMYQCVKLQEEMQEIVNQYRIDNNVVGYTRLSKAQLAELEAIISERYGSLPHCPFDETIDLFNTNNGSISCRRHEYDYSYDPTPKSNDAASN